MTITELHNEVLDFLLEARKHYPDLYFYLQKPTPDNHGFWFPSTKEKLMIYFWEEPTESSDKAYISFEIGIDGICHLIFDAEGEEEMGKILGQIADILALDIEFTSKQLANHNIWIRDFGWDSWGKKKRSWQDGLEWFLEMNKIMIDKVLPLFHTQDAIKSISIPNFEARLAEIQEIRQKNIPTVTAPLQKQFVPKTATLQNIGHFSNISIDLSKQITCFVGDNGSGKSTILRAIALGLIGTSHEAIEAERLDIQSFLTVKDFTEGNEIVYEMQGKIIVNYKWNWDNENEIIFENKNWKGVKVYDAKPLNSNSFGLNDENDLLKTLILGFPQGTGKRMKDETRLYQHTKPNVYDVLPLILDVYDHRIERFKIWLDIQYKNHLKTGKAESIFLQTITYTFSLISRIISKNESESELVFKTVNYPENGDFQIIVNTPTNPDGILFDLLSTGLNGLFSWIGHFVSRLQQANPDALTIDALKQKSAVIILDEIDNYLHPKVQTYILPILADEFPNVYFIVSTHSPLVLISLDNTKTTAYSVENKGVEKIEHFYGRKIQDIIYQEYGIPERPVKAIKEKVDDLLEAIYEEDKPVIKELYDELRVILGDDDTAILEAQLVLEKQESYDTNP